MTPAPLLLAALTLASPATPAAPAGGTRDRSEIPEKYRWDLRDLFPSDAAWTDARAALAARIPAFARHRGHLGDSARALGDALTEMGALQLAMDRLSAYASMRSDEDTRVAGPRELRQQAERLGVELDAALSFVRPELLALDAARVRSFLATDPRLKDWSFYLSDVLRWKPHTLSPSEERLVARAGDLMGAGRDVHAVLSNADLPYPTVTLSTGESVRLDPAGYARVRTAARPDDRERVFRAYFGAVKQYERTMGAALAARIRGHLFEKEVHEFPSALEAYLFRDAIPPAVYRQLLADVNASLPTLHRYLRLRRRMLGVPELRYEDLYAPIVKAVDRRWSPDEAVALTREALAPLGQPYVATLTQGLESRWTDFLPATGKRSGAYSNAVYGVHPFQLLNFNGQWEDVSTLAHESGHSMHSVLAAAAQPYPKFSYPTFVAEVASTLNEDLLFHDALARAKDDPTRLFLLGRRLESLRTTLFRQAMFAEFELLANERAERGEAVTGESLSELYLGIVRKYYGHAQGVCRVDALYGVEWASVPHFFNYDFYVFQYATSLVASTALSKAIREDAARGRTDARDRYLALLAAGGSDYGVDLLRRAGVDMTTPAPFAAAMAEMNQVMDRMEGILGKGAAASER